MGWKRTRTAGLAAAATATAAIAGVAPGTAQPPEPLLVQAEPGAVGEAVDELGASALRVQRRDGRALQVVASPERAAAIRRLDGVASATPAPPSFADGEITTQGFNRTGASGLGALGREGQGLVIAILDRGFGRNVDRFQAKGELPPDSRLETRTFDSTRGLAGVNAYGNATNHGELVAQTVYDYAPRARYLFVNYDTRLDFLAATAWLTRRRPDIVVHSNSFIDGRFDGRGREAAAVNAAAAAGVLWFNSAGNYAQRHWSGPWTDADGNGDHEWPREGGLTVYRAAGQPLTYALSWRSPPGGPRTDIDLVLERLTPGNVWQQVASSRASQTQGAVETELILGYRPKTQNFFRLRAVLADGPPPQGPMTLFSREIDLRLIGGGPDSSQPSPGDAEGAISVGAVDWRGDILKDYSSRGPTDDGRSKPDLVAPTNTAVAGLTGRRSVGGTSNAAPNAAGAAALLLVALRRQGVDPTPAGMRSLLTSTALDLGAAGPDPLFGAGRVRVVTAPPRVLAPRPRPRSAVGGRTVVQFRHGGRTPLVRWRLSVDDEVVPGRRRTSLTKAGLDTRRLKDGWHLVRVEAEDWAGNETTREWPIRVDNTRPRLSLRGTRVSGGGARRAVALRLSAADRGATGRLTVTVRVQNGRRTVRTTRFRLRQRKVATNPVGRLAPGRYTLRVTLTDAAGNETRRAQRLVVPARR